MKLHSLLLILFPVFFIGLLTQVVSANHAVDFCNNLDPACPANHTCNFTTGLCVDSGPNPSPTPTTPVTGGCNRSGCGGLTSNCPWGQMCASAGNLMLRCRTATASENCPTQDPNTCNGAGQPCSPCCKPGLTCSPDNNNRCLPPADIVCHSSGCSIGECGYGYRCENSRCTVDATCARDTIDVPYTGPKINSFSNLMSRIYNLLFPAAILYGVIMVLKAGYILMTSEGNPQKTRLGQEDLTAAIMGTAFVVLSAAILRIIIVQFLGGSVGF